MKPTENIWINVKDKMPPMFEFVEVIYPDKSCLCELNRDFCATIEEDGEVIWIAIGHTEKDWSSKGFGIKHWRPMAVDHKSRKPFVKIDKNGYFKIYLKKVNQTF